jgi:hypothetical protein
MNLQSDQVVPNLCAIERGLFIQLRFDVWLQKRRLQFLGKTIFSGLDFRIRWSVLKSDANLANP